MGACLLMRTGHEQIYEIGNYEINIFISNKSNIASRNMTLVTRFILEHCARFIPRLFHYGIVIYSFRIELRKID